MCLTIQGPIRRLFEVYMAQGEYILDQSIAYSLRLNEYIRCSREMVILFCTCGFSVLGGEKKMCIASSSVPASEGVRGVCPRWLLLLPESDSARVYSIAIISMSQEAIGNPFCSLVVVVFKDTALVVNPVLQLR